MNTKYEYGQGLLDSGVITADEFANWNEDKEYYYSEMDRVYDYLWSEDEDGIHFIDYLYSMGKEDETVQKRREMNELELHFKSFVEVAEWIREFQKREETIPNRWW